MFAVGRVVNRSLFPYFPGGPRVGILGHQFDKRLESFAPSLPFYWRILKKTILFSGFEILSKKSVKQ
jgi:hypothetical protein